MAESKKYAKIPIEDYRKIVVLLRWILKAEERKAASMYRINPDITPHECINRIEKIHMLLNDLGAHTESVPKLDKEDIL